MDFAFFNAHGIPQSKYGHPTTKSVDLMKWLISHHTNPGDLILDPFAGSGTTLVAAKELGRRYIGIEQDFSYCRTANDRLLQEEMILK